MNIQNLETKLFLATSKLAASTEIDSDDEEMEEEEQKQVKDDFDTERNKGIRKQNKKPVRRTNSEEEKDSDSLSQRNMREGKMTINQE